MSSRVETRLRALERAARAASEDDPITEVWRQTTSPTGEILFELSTASRKITKTPAELDAEPVPDGVIRILVVRGETGAFKTERF